MRAGIINVTGYTGVELARLLYHHPQVKLTSVTGRSAVGQTLGQVFPHLADLALPITAELDDVDVVFSALPHRASAEALLPAIKQGKKVIDLSADFRLKDVTEYESWYEVTHPCPELLSEAVYGLTESNCSSVAASHLIANPGCYPTSAILALAPAVKARLIQPEIIVDSKSGVSGAGRTLGLMYHFSEANENVSAYALDGHRHLPEIVQELQKLSLQPALSVTFLPHLIPMTRGILSSCYATLAEGKLANGEKSKEEIRQSSSRFLSRGAFCQGRGDPTPDQADLG